MLLPAPLPALQVEHAGEPLRGTPAGIGVPNDVSGAQMTPAGSDAMAPASVTIVERYISMPSTRLSWAAIHGAPGGYSKPPPPEPAVGYVGR